VCSSAKRFIIHEKVYDEFVERLKKDLDSFIKIGDPIDMTTTIGPLVFPKAKSDLKSQI